jgi:teichuronic acid biosynthesis protein TuaE
MMTGVQDFREQAFKISPRTMLWGLATLLAFLEFFQINYHLSSALTFVMMPMAIAWMLIYPKTLLIRKEEFEPVLFLFFWLGYSLCSYVWAQDRFLALDYSLLIFRFLFLFMFFSAVFRDRRLLNKLPVFLAFIALLYVGTAIWEILTLNHLPPSRLYGDRYFIPTGPFYGENHLAAAMTLLFPFLLLLPEVYPRLWVKIGTLIAILATIFVIIIQGARISMLAIGAVLAWFLVFHTKARTWMALLLLMALIFGALHHYVPDLLGFGLKMLGREVSSFGVESKTVRMSSIGIRKQLFVEGFDLAAESTFMGVGGGNFEHYMNTDREFRTAGITNPHNWVLEIFGNFGILILAGFLYLYIKWLYILYVKYRHSSGREKNICLMYLVSLLLFIASSSLPSTIKWMHLIWIYFAGINAYCFSPKPVYEDNK